MNNPMVSSKRWYAGKPVREYPLESILSLTPLDLGFIEQIRQEVLSGLRNPVVVVQCTVMDIIQNAEDSYLELPSTFLEDYGYHPKLEVLVVCGGASRMQIAEEAGYDGISAIRVRSFHEAKSIQAQQKGEESRTPLESRTAHAEQ